MQAWLVMESELFFSLLSCLPNLEIGLGALFKSNWHQLKSCSPWTVPVHKNIIAGDTSLHIFTSMVLNNLHD